MLVVGRHACYVRLIQITVVLLRPSDEVYYAVHCVFELGVFLQGEQIGGTFHHLVQVGSHETVWKRQFVLHSVQVVAGLAQVVHCRAHLVEGERNKYFFLCLEAWKPEVVLQRDLLERDGLEHLFACLLAFRCAR